MKYTNRKILPAIAAFVFVLGGCAPLQQAPLVYSSKVTLGVDLSATATEQPGVSLNLGYKQIDAAYVPVAVAKPCDLQDAKNELCAGDNYKLQQIRGDNTVDDSQGSRDKLEGAQKLLSDYSTANDKRKTATQAAIDAQAELDKVKKLQQDNSAALEANKGEIATAEGLLKSANAQEVADSKKKEDDIKKAQQQVNDAKSKQAQLIQMQVDLAKRLQNASDDLGNKQKQKSDAEKNFDLVDISKDPAKLADALKIVVTGSNKKGDAYSVFGSFDASTKIATEGGTSAKGEGGVTLGKVFSTGVASQNLSLGLQGFYANIGRARANAAYRGCLDTAVSALDRTGIPKEVEKQTAEQKKVISALFGGCMTALEDVVVGVSK